MRRRGGGRGQGGGHGGVGRYTGGAWDEKRLGARADEGEVEDGCGPWLK